MCQLSTEFSPRLAARTKSIFDRLSDKQIKKDGCWSWTGSKDGAGYGTLSNRNGRLGTPEKAHRVSFENAYGPIPEGMVVCHKCDNPECTNPNHLFLGTQKDNMRDCSRKGRLNPKSLLNLRRHRALTERQVEKIRSITFVGSNGRGLGRQVKEVAKEYGVCEDIIRDIKYDRYEGRKS